MDHLKRLTRHLALSIFWWVSGLLVMVIVSVWLGLTVLSLPDGLVLLIVAAVGVGLSIIVAVAVARYVTEPVRYLWQAILHVSPGASGTGAPNLEQVRVARELVTSLVLQVYQLASGVEKGSAQSTASKRPEIIVNNLPSPLFVLNKEKMIVTANSSAAAYVGLQLEEIIGKNVYSILDMSFPNENTFDAWLTHNQNAVTATKTWERVRLRLADSRTLRQFDLAAYYNQNNPEGVETILVLFDHSQTYYQDDQAMSYVALAVHELRTPLTTLRGYIEVFEEELASQLNPELKDFMYKMKVSAQQLAAFVNNILNVARIDENQLSLSLNQENWSTILRSALSDLSLRAQVHGKVIQTEIAADLPLAAVDRMSIVEVINNLIDNAIKYSVQNNQIVVRSYLTSNGLIETTVQDFGVGVPESVIPNLFDKFYRSHRSRGQIGGTGLGLYLSKAIVTAHGGNIWVRSKEGQGATFGFTLQPYAKVAAELKNTDNKDIVMGAHGWIKNHSLYRR